MATPKVIQKSVNKWLAKRLPRSRAVKLTLNNIFILPSKKSLGLLLVLALMLIAAINYQNSLIYLFAFWLSSAWLVSIHMTFRNLAGVNIEVIGHENCHAEQQATVILRITPNKARLDDLCLYWDKPIKAPPFWLSFHENEPKQIELTYPSKKRGPLQPERLVVAVRSPAGLAVAWSQILLQVDWLIYPKPQKRVEHHLEAHHVHSNEEVTQRSQEGQTDYSHLRRYQAGDHLKRIHWRHYAKTDELSTRVFVDYRKNDQWIYWHEYDGLDLEARLSAICAKVLDYSAQQINFGLSLPEQEFAASKGEHHTQLCLEALAAYGHA